MKVGDYVERKKGGKIGYIYFMSGTKLTSSVRWFDEHEGRTQTEEISTNGLKPFDTTGMLFVVRDFTDDYRDNVYVGHDLDAARTAYDRFQFGDAAIERWLNGRLFLTGPREIRPESFSRYEHVI